MIPDWVREADTLSISATATQLGMVPGTHRTWGPCPSCSATTRGHHDKRGPIGLRGDTGWRCHRCQAGGRALTLIAWAVTGQATWRKPWAQEIRAWLADRSVVVTPNASVEEPPAPVYPPAPEVAEVWRRSSPPRADVAVWLMSRALSVDRVSGLDLVRCLPDGPLPRWASHWPGLGCRAVIPLFDHLGNMRSLQGRATQAGAPKKSVAAREVARLGLVFASPSAREILRIGGARKVIVAEGEPDFLTWAMMGEPVLGIPGSGAWSEAVGKRLRGCDVIVRVHEDDAGRSYLGKILPTLATTKSVRALKGLRSSD